MRGAQRRYTIWLVCIGVLVLLPFSGESQEMVNINTASAEKLQELHGIGEVISSRIVTYRQSNGDFNSIEEIQDVKGIGPATFEDIKDSITVGSTSTDTDRDGEQDEDGTEDEPPTDAGGESTDESEGSNDGGGEYDSMIGSPLDVTLDIAPSTVVARAPVTFTLDARIEESEANSTSFMLSLGDGARVRGKEITYTYAGPGTYVVVVDAETREKEVRIKRELTVHEGNVVIDDVSVGPDGSVTLENSDAQEYLLAGWKLKSNGKVYTIADDTFIPANGSITLPSSVTDLYVTPSGVTLEYPDGTQASVYAPEGGARQRRSIQRGQHSSASVSPSAAASGRVAGASYASPSEKSEAASEVSTDQQQGELPASSSVTTESLASEEGGTSVMPWVAALSGVLGLAAVGILGIRSGSSSALTGVNEGDNRTAPSDNDADAYTVVEVNGNEEERSREP